jgi:hypothetical protein
MSKLSFALTLTLAMSAMAGQALALNPQPLPPRWSGPHIPGGKQPVRHVPVVRY